MRGDCATCCRPTRMAPTKRSPGSALVRGSSASAGSARRPAPASTALSTNTAGRAPAWPAAHRPAPGRPRATGSSRCRSAPAPPAVVARHGLRHDGGEHRPAHRQADAVGEGQQQQQLRVSSRPAPARPAAVRSPTPTAACRRSSAGGRRCRPARRWAGRAGTPASVLAVCTSATITGLVVSVVISQAGRHVVHPHREVGRQPGEPQAAEDRDLQRGSAAGSGHHKHHERPQPG
jgi:hypothetical protein